MTKYNLAPNAAPKSRSLQNNGMIKKYIRATMFLVLVVCMSMIFSSCNKKDTGKLQLVDKLDNGTVFEFGGELEFPAGQVVDKKGNVLSTDVKYTLLPVGGKAQESRYPVFNCSKGDFSLKYEYEKQLIERKFSVKDTIKPKVEFNNVPTSLFFGVDETGKLPDVKIDDASEVTMKSDLIFKNSDGVTKTADFSMMTSRFQIKEAGLYTYKVTVIDDSGNQTEKEVSWRAKDSAWTDKTLKPGYLADFDEENYCNLISDGDVGTYYNSTFTEEFLPEFGNAKGVYKLQLNFNQFSNASVKIKLPKTITPKSLGDGLITVRLRIDEKNTNGIVRLAAINKQASIGDNAATKGYDIKYGEWSELTLTREELVNYIFSKSETDPFQYLQIVVGGTGANTTVYIDSITIAYKLKQPTGLAISNGRLTWDKVANATGYSVLESEVDTKTSNMSYTLKANKTFVAVRALGDGLFWIDSEPSFKVTGLNVKAGYLATFDDPIYQYLISKDVNLGSETSGYMPTSITSSYDAAKNTVKSVIGPGSWGIVSSVAVYFPQPVKIDPTKKIVIRMKIEGTNVNVVRVANLGYTTINTLAVKKGEFYNYSFDAFTDNDQSQVITGLQLLFSSGSNTLTVSPTVTFEYITVATMLATPVLTLNQQQGTITWKAIAGTDKYTVSVKNGTPVQQTATSFKYPAKDYGTITVKAKGNGITTLDSAGAVQKYDYRLILNIPTNFIKQGRTLSWSAVSGAKGYKVKVNGKEYSVASKSYELNNSAYASDYVTVQVKALGDNTSTVDSDYTNAWKGDLSLANNYIADFDKGYTQLISGNVMGIIDPGYKPVAPVGTTFILNQGVKATIGQGVWGFVTAVAVRFPYAIKESELGDNVRIRMKIEAAGVKTVEIRNLNGGIIVSIPIKQGVFYNYDIPKDKFWALFDGAATIDGIQLSFNKFEGIVNASVIFESITTNQILATPVLILNQSEDRISWTAIEGAVKYEVRVNNNKSVLQTGTSFTYPASGFGTVAVKAKGNGVTTLDSAEALQNYDYRLILNAPTGFTKQGTTLNWTAITGANGYKIKVNGVEYNASANSYELTNAAYAGDYVVVQVKALGDNTLTVDSVYAAAWKGDLSLANSYLADFDKGYTQLVSGNVLGILDPGYKPVTTVTTDYILGQGVKAGIGPGSWGIVTAVSVHLPRVITRSELGDSVIIRMKIDAAGVDTVGIRNFNGSLIVNAPVQQGIFSDYYIPKDKYDALFDWTDSIEDIQFSFNNAEGITNVSVTFASITTSVILSTPVLTLNQSEGKITWNAVDGALKYEIKVNNGLPTQQTATSFTYPASGNGTVTVKAIGNGTTILNSAIASQVYDSRLITTAPTGYTMQGTTLTWTAVSGANGYKVKVNGLEYAAATNSYELTNAAYAGDYVTVQVKTLGDNTLTVDSSYAQAWNGDLSLAPGYLADFDKGYTSLVEKSTEVSMNAGQISRTFEVTYDATEQAVKSVFGNGDWEVGAGIQIRFPRQITVADNKSVTIRLKVTGATKVSFYRLDGTGSFDTVLGTTQQTLTGQWQEFTFLNVRGDQNDEAFISGMQMVFNTAGTVYFDSVTYIENVIIPGVQQVAAPSQTTWDVYYLIMQTDDNYAGYLRWIVEINGTEYIMGNDTTSGWSFKVLSSYTGSTTADLNIRVKTVGAGLVGGITYTDSDWSNYMTVLAGTYA